MFPSDMTDHPAVPIIKKLLNRAPFQRGTPASLKKHDWFAETNWEDIYYRADRPPFIPTKESIDVSNRMKGSVQDVLLDDERRNPVHGKLHHPTKGWDENF